MECDIFFFFFSSRRRHTRFDCDWSSDVCSSDLLLRHGREELLDARPLGPPVSVAELDQRRSEEHTSELQSQSNLVCRLLLEKKKKTQGFPSSIHQTCARRQAICTNSKAD